MSLVLSAMGSATNNIPVAVLGLTVIEQSSNFIQDDNTDIVPTTPNYAGTLLLMGQVSGAAIVPTDLTGTFKGVVKGY